MKWFRSNPEKKLEKEYRHKLNEAMMAGRSGNIQGQALLMAEADEILNKLNELRKNSIK